MKTQREAGLYRKMLTSILEQPIPRGRSGLLVAKAGLAARRRCVPPGGGWCQVRRDAKRRQCRHKCSIVGESDARLMANG